jgi:hypothetical protein
MPGIELVRHQHFSDSHLSQFGVGIPPPGLVRGIKTLVTD